MFPLYDYQQTFITGGFTQQPNRRQVESAPVSVTTRADDLKQEVGASPAVVVMKTQSMMFHNSVQVVFVPEPTRASAQIHAEKCNIKKRPVLT